MLPTPSASEFHHAVYALKLARLERALKAKLPVIQSSPSARQDLSRPMASVPKAMTRPKQKLPTALVLLRYDGRLSMSSQFHPM